MLKIRAMDPEETRHRLRDARQPVVGLAAMQQQLREIDVALPAVAPDRIGANS